MAFRLSIDQLRHNTELLLTQPLSSLVADSTGKLYKRGTLRGICHTLVNSLSFSNSHRMRVATEATCEALEEIPDNLRRMRDSQQISDDLVQFVKRLHSGHPHHIEDIHSPLFRKALAVACSEHTQELLRQLAVPRPVEEVIPIPTADDKDILIEALQGQVNTLQGRLEQITDAAAVLKAEPPIIAEEERAMLTSMMANEIKKLSRVIDKMEQPQSAKEEQLPPPLQLARELELKASGRIPRPSDEENLDKLKQLRERLEHILTNQG